MKKILLIAFFAVACSAPPKGKPGDTRSLYEKILAGAQPEAWKKTAAISFDFRGKHRIFWDRNRGLIEVSWSTWSDDIMVQLDKKTWKSLVTVDGKKLANGKKKSELTKKAFSFFINDSYWLQPALQLEHASLSLSEDGGGLIATFPSGGVTPGDVYLFRAASDGRLESMQMWVSILPVKGVTASFDSYQKMDTGIEIATEHKLMIFNVKLSDLKTWAEYPATGEEDRFSALLSAG